MSVSSNAAGQTDAALWSQVRHDDHESFGVLFDRHAAAVTSYLYRELGSWPDAEDVTGAVFLTAWQQRHKHVDIEDSLRPWLIGVARNTARNATRARRRYDRALRRLQFEDSPLVASDDQRALIAEERGRAPVDLLAALPERERVVVDLYYQRGATLNETAEQLGLPLGTVKSRLSRARRRLRNIRIHQQAASDEGTAR